MTVSAPLSGRNASILLRIALTFGLLQAATLVTGHIGLLQGLAYIVAQLSGACIAILLVVSPSTM